MTYEIIFTNGGTAVFQSDYYVHCYQDMQQLANDVKAYIAANGDTYGWEGHEPEHRISDEEYFEHAPNGGYMAINEDDELSEYAETSWRNVYDFVAAMQGRNIIIKADIENNAEEFWEAFEKEYPSIAHDVCNGYAKVDTITWQKLQQLPGFSNGPSYAKNALIAQVSLRT